MTTDLSKPTLTRPFMQTGSSAWNSCGSTSSSFVLFCFLFFWWGVDTITYVCHLLPLFLPFPKPSPRHHIIVCVHGLIYAYMFFGSSLPVPPCPFPSLIYQSVPCIHASGLVLFISLFCSLDSAYK